MTEALRLALAGCVVGLPLAGFLSRSTAGLIYGVRPSDPLIWGGALLAVLGVAVVASVVPARRAARLEPLVAIRSE
jgi:ABC-type antimicrobial peptide transport system permease subunit